MVKMRDFRCMVAIGLCFVVGCLDKTLGAGYDNNGNSTTVRCYDCHYDPRQTGRFRRAAVAYGRPRGFPQCALDDPDDEWRVDRWPCKSKTCFIRNDHNGLVYRGCADHWNLPWGVDTSKNCAEQGMKPSTYWFCQGDLCNTATFDDVCSGTEKEAEVDDDNFGSYSYSVYGPSEHYDAQPETDIVYGLQPPVDTQPAPDPSIDPRFESAYRSLVGGGSDQPNGGEYQYYPDPRPTSVPTEKSFVAYPHEPRNYDYMFPSYDNGNANNQNDYPPQQYGGSDISKSSVYKSENPSDFKSHNPSDYKSHNPSDYKSHNPSDYKSHSPSDYKSHNPSDYKSHKSSDFKSHNPSDYKSHNPSDYKSWQPEAPPSKSWQPQTKSWQPQPTPTWQTQEPTKSWQPQEPAKSWQPKEPAKSWQPQEPAKSWQPQEPTKSWQPQENAKSWQPQAKSWQPQEPAKSWQPRMSNSAKSWQSGTPAPKSWQSEELVKSQPQISQAKSYQPPMKSHGPAVKSYDTPVPAAPVGVPNSHLYPQPPPYGAYPAFQVYPPSPPPPNQQAQGEQVRVQESLLNSLYQTNKGTQQQQQLFGIPQGKQASVQQAVDMYAYEPYAYPQPRKSNGNNANGNDYNWDSLGEENNAYDADFLEVLQNPCDGRCQGNPSGLFAHPTRDDWFVQCGSGVEYGKSCKCCKPYYLRCPAGTAFDQKTRICSEQSGGNSLDSY